MEQWGLNSHQQRDANRELLGVLHPGEVLQLLQVSEPQVWKSGVADLRSRGSWRLDIDSYKNKFPFAAELWALEGCGRNESPWLPLQFPQWMEKGLCESRKPLTSLFLLSLEDNLPFQRSSLMRLCLWSSSAHVYRAKWTLIGWMGVHTNKV